MIQLIPFNDLSPTQTTMVLSWRNHPEIRVWMLQQGEISMEEHLHFIESLPKRIDKLYFLVKNGNDSLGVVDLTNITSSSAEIGIYANPEKRGVGALLMEALIRYAFDTLKLTKLIANVLSNNEKAKRLYQKFDFKETDRMTYDEREMICMERNNDNR